MRTQIQMRLNRQLEAGMSSAIESVLLFARWADTMGARLTPGAIKDRYGCSRATSYRWFHAYRDAHERMAA